MARLPFHIVSFNKKAFQHGNLDSTFRFTTNFYLEMIVEIMYTGDMEQTESYLGWVKKRMNNIRHPLYCTSKI